jgi:ABC-type phosphate/phosphonate transport system ATPase subunit
MGIAQGTVVFDDIPQHLDEEAMNEIYKLDNKKIVSVA